MSGSKLTTPGVRVLANGQVLTGILSGQWGVPLAYNAARHAIVKGFTKGDPNPPQWWVNTGNKKISIEIQVAKDQSGFVSVFTGIVDSHTFDPIGRSISLAGRDNTALFIDARIADTYRNLTSSEIATKLAAGHGMTAQVTNTTTLVGRYYDTDHDVTTASSFSRAVSEWDLICLLGQRERFLPYVQGNVLYFQAPPSPPPSYPLWVTQDGQNGVVTSNCLRLSCTRNLTMAHDVNVEVKSWHSGKKQVVIGKAVTKTAAQPSGTDPVTNYDFDIPNLSRAQADVEAQNLAMDIAQHERTISADIPGETTITPQHVFPLSGTGTDYDGIDYFPDDITNTLSMQGFKTTINCKNYSPLSLYDGASGALIR